MSAIKTQFEWLFREEALIALASTQRGIERETMRISECGAIAQDPHPRSLGASLFHPSITTDYSESLLELITKPHTSIEQCLAELTGLHQYVQHKISTQRLWPMSMPPEIQSERCIPIAHYGDSCLGRFKHIYRLGLEQRYGRTMQSIAGLHYNISFSQDFWRLFATENTITTPLQSFTDERYFGLIRQFKRYGWILLLLTGTSPRAHASFVSPSRAAASGLIRYGEDWIAPNGCSLRMGDLGYSNASQGDLFVCYDNVNRYVQTITRALQIPQPEFEAKGLFNSQGQRIQITTNQLQIENEFYANIRPKQPAQPGERPSSALGDRGVAYIEVRNLDNDPTSPIGIQSITGAMVELFCLGLLLMPSPPLSRKDCQLARVRDQATAMDGRRPEQGLLASAYSFWLTLEPAARALGQAYNHSIYEQAYELGIAMLSGQQSLPSEQVVNRATSFLEYGISMANQHRATLTQALALDQQHQLDTSVLASLAQADASPVCSDTELQAYIDQYFAKLSIERLDGCHALE